jgi:CopG family nickel-responsive transcriptional regulator
MVLLLGMCFSSVTTTWASFENQGAVMLVDGLFGGLLWPLRGKTSSGFGERIDPIQGSPVGPFGRSFEVAGTLWFYDARPTVARTFKESLQHRKGWMIVTKKLARFGVTVPEDVLSEFDQRLEQSGKDNRSDVIRQLIRSYITEERWQEEDGQVYGTITLMYDHHSPCISKDLTSIQHDHGEHIVCTTHVHVTHDTCLECIVLKGKASHIRSFIQALGKIRGLKSTDAVITSGI